MGSLATFLGAALVGVLAAIFSAWMDAAAFGSLSVILAALLGGVSGAFFDSFLGATVQAIYFCPTCQKETERHPLHVCGAQTSRLRGWRWLNNDMVNFLSSLGGASIAAGVFLLV